jgi:hypothetical protein
MTPHKGYFKVLKFQDMGSVKLGDSRPCKIEGQGVVKVEIGKWHQGGAV